MFVVRCSALPVFCVLMFSLLGAQSASADIADSDWEGLPDFQEAMSGTNPLVADSDGGGLIDLAELFLGSDPNNSADDAGFFIGDTDADGLDDRNEDISSFPISSARIYSDYDGMSDGAELLSARTPVSRELSTPVGYGWRWRLRRFRIV